jgi:hypothetical protein
MTMDQWKAEQEAYKSLSEVLEKVEKCRVLFEQARLTLPEPLKRFLTTTTNGTDGSGHRPQSSVVIPPPDAPPRPSDASLDWIFMQATDVTPAALTLAVMRAAKGPIRPRDIIERVTAISPKTPGGSVSNVGTRLSGKLINRTDDGWQLIDETAVPILHEGWVWGPAKVFDPHDLALHRRDAILHLLKCNPAGLQIVQLVDQLRSCPWVYAPISKDLLKADMEVLARDSKVKKRGNSGKWEIPQRKDQ